MALEENQDWQSTIARRIRREKTAHSVLGVSECASIEEIRRAFRRKSRTVHPDTNTGDPEAARRFHLLCCAYKCLAQGMACEAMDEAGRERTDVRTSTYSLNNPWGYWCWWRKQYFG